MKKKGRAIHIDKMLNSNSLQKLKTLKYPSTLRPCHVTKLKLSYSFLPLTKDSLYFERDSFIRKKMAYQVKNKVKAWKRIISLGEDYQV